MGQDNIHSTVVGTVGDQKVSYGELVQNFSNNNSSTPSIEDLETFLPVYLDYKAKLLEGKDLGYYKDSALVAEHRQYAKQAAYGYWLEKEIKPLAFDEFKKRSEVELKLYHILITLNENASSSVIDETISKLQDAKAEIENGIPLEKVNQKYSSVYSGRSMGGDIPWISAGRAVKEFEDQVYDLEIGEVSEPFRSRFGYHIVLLQDIRERTPSRLVSHIYIRDRNDSSAYIKSHNAFKALEDGENWKQVVDQYSEDRASVPKGGNIGWVSYQANFGMNFVDAVMNVNPEKPYSKPIETNYGYHIFKIDSVETYRDEEAWNKALRDRLEKSSYYEENSTFVLNYLKEKFGEEITEEHIIDLTIENYPEFKEQFESYLNGLVVFNINEDHIWSASTVDSTRLKDIYNNHDDEYRYPARPFYYLITARHDTTLDKAIEFVNSGESLDSLKTRFDKLRVSLDSTSINLEEPFNKLEEMELGSFSDKFDYKNRRGIFWLEDYLPPRRMSFEEAFNRLLTEFQPQREQEWLDYLREKYKVEPHYSNLRKAYQEDHH